jgi:hypothetical protein
MKHYESSTPLLAQFCGFLAVIGTTLIITGESAAQNLVPNPSFETHTSCPTFMSQFSLASPWVPSGTVGTPDYFHACATSASLVSVPTNTFGNQAPHTGSAYAGFIARPSMQVREYLQTTLTSPLVAGTAYRVEFYVSLADTSQWGVDTLGAYLSAGPAPASTGYIIPVTPHVLSPAGTAITNKVGWTLVSGTYVATGGEDHIVIGNFADNTASIPVTGLGGTYPGSYYYIDDVSVTQAPCAVPAADMVNWWAFDETTGTLAQDLMGTTNNVGTLMNGPTFTAGRVDGAFSFDGVNDYVKVPDGPELNFKDGCVLDIAEPMTIDLWLKTNLGRAEMGATSGLRTVLDKRAQTPTVNGYHLYISNGRLGFQMNGTNYVAPASGPNYVNIADNQWHFVAVSLSMCRGGSGFLYVDGKTVLTTPPGLGFSNNIDLSIGRRSPAFWPFASFKGVLDELEIFKRKLTSTELDAIWQAGSRGKCKTNCATNPSPCRTIPKR